MQTTSKLELITPADIARILIAGVVGGSIFLYVTTPRPTVKIDPLEFGFGDYNDGESIKTLKMVQQSGIATQPELLPQPDTAGQHNLGQQPKQSNTLTVKTWQIQDTSIPCTSGLPGNHIAWSAEHGKFMNFCLVNTQTQEAQ